MRSSARALAIVSLVLAVTRTLAEPLTPTPRAEAYAASNSGAQGPRVTAAATSVFRQDPEHSGVYPSSGNGIYGGVLWRRQTGGAVRSSPTIVDDLVLVGSSDGNFYALDARSGQERWRFRADSAIASSAAAANGRVYFSSYKGTFYALNVDNGKLRWTVKFAADAPLAYEHETGRSPAAYDGDFILSSAAILTGTVVVGAGDGLIYALDEKSGKAHWTFRTEGRVRSSPAISNGVVYVASYDGSVYAIDFNSGRLDWRYDTRGRSLNSADFGFDRRSIIASPAVYRGTVYVGSRDAHLYAIDAVKGTLRWIYNYEKDDMTWSMSSPAVSDEVVYAGTADGFFVHALQASDGREIWRFVMPSRVWASPTVAGSKVYVTNQSGDLFAIDRTTGKESWHFQTRLSVESSPSAAKGVVYFGSDDGGVYAIRTDGTKPMRRAIYWDEKTAKLDANIWEGAGFPVTVKDQAAFYDYFQARGYEVVSSTTLGEWLAGRISDHAPSVVAFAICTLPKAVVGSDPANGLFRQYLNSGGKVVWIGAPPLITNLIVEKGDQIVGVSIDRDAAGKLLGISYEGALHNNINNNLVTVVGRDWGLGEWWLGSWDVPLTSEITPLSLDDRGFAGAFVRNYGGAPGTGFVYVGLVAWDREMLSRLALVAEYRPQ